MRSEQNDEHEASAMQVLEQINSATKSGKGKRASKAPPKTRSSKSLSSVITRSEDSPLRESKASKAGSSKSMSFFSDISDDDETNTPKVKRLA